MKLLFFDIDGTIWDWKNMIPESTRDAIRKTREKGNLAFINSGRTRGYIHNKDLLGVGFDGIISGCGTMIEYNGERIYYARMPRELAEEVTGGVRRYGWKPILEGAEYLYMDYEDFEGDMYGEKLVREMGERLKPLTSEWGKWEIQKLSCKMTGLTPEDNERCIKEFSDRFDFILHTAEVCEMVPRPHDKGTGITFLCEKLGVPIGDTYAFGDSVNDKGMLETAGNAIVMGNGTDRAKEMADYVTDDLEADGIWKACEHYGLI